MNSDNTKNCNFCGEELSAEARRCPYCGSLLQVRIGEGPWNENNQTLLDQAGFTEATDEAAKVESENNETVQSERIGFQEAEKVGYPAKKVSMEVEADKTRNNSLSNRKKVLITVLSTLLPGIGQLIGIILSIFYLSNEEDEDRKSFGSALMAASIVVFFVSLLFYFILFMVIAVISGAYQ